jgi:hypothetical protein
LLRARRPEEWDLSSGLSYFCMESLGPHTR